MGIIVHLKGLAVVQSEPQVLGHRVPRITVFEQAAQKLAWK